ncbi:MAG: hypothetical protein ACE15D_06635 [Candidatus Eisenbacteria bacterium]|nr:hypothetical protein [Candidatus Eisenbacteria bacterium]
MQGCDPIRNQEFALGEMRGEEAARHRDHLAGCSRCRLEVEQFQELFGDLAAMPRVPVPDGIPQAVLARLGSAPSEEGALSGLGDPATRLPLAAAVSGIVAGVLLGLFRNSLLQAFGGFAHQALRGAGELLEWLSAGITQIDAVGPLLRLAVQLLLLFEKVGRAMAEVVRVLPGQVRWDSVALALATLLVLGRFIASIGREKIGHVEHS